MRVDVYHIGAILYNASLILWDPPHFCGCKK